MSAAGIWAVAVRCGVLLPVNGNGSGGDAAQQYSLAFNWLVRSTAAQDEGRKRERSEMRRQWPHIWPHFFLLKWTGKIFSTHMILFSGDWVASVKEWWSRGRRV